MAPEGGLFHDGRACDLLEQVQSPLFHKQEMNLPDRATLAQRMRKADYSPALREWVGEESWNDDEKLNQFAFRALVEFLREPLFRPFDARIDDFLAGDENALTVVEKRGLEVFRNAGKCADCHLLEADQWSKPLLSDFGYDNLRVPSREKPDPGLGGISKKEVEIGQFRAPTLRIFPIFLDPLGNLFLKLIEVFPISILGSRRGQCVPFFLCYIGTHGVIMREIRHCAADTTATGVSLWNETAEA